MTTQANNRNHWMRSSMVYAFSLVLITFSSILTFAQSVGPNNAGTGTNVPIGSNTDWSNPGNITAVGTPYATATVPGQAYTDYLQGTGYGFSVPTNATINGIVVTINRTGTQNWFLVTFGIRDDAVYLVKNNIIQTSGNNKASSSLWPTSLGTATYGGSNDLWDLIWTPADINNSNFGVALSAFCTRPANSHTATVDYMQITVYYTLPPAPTVTGFSPTSACSGSSQSVTITGTNFTGATAVTFFNGQTASYTVNSPTQLTATLPAGATTGAISVTTPSGTGISSTNFTVNSTPATPTNPTATPSTICTGGSSTLSATVGSGETVDWFTGSCGGTAVTSPVSPASTTTYYGRARNTTTGCVSTGCVTVEVTVNPVPTFSTDVISDVACHDGSDGSFELTVTSDDKSPYKFSMNGGGFIGLPQEDHPVYSITGLPSNTYNIVIQDKDGCESAPCP